jgi:hypothetical protein
VPEVTIQPDASAGEDAYTNSASQATNYGTATQLYLTNTIAGVTRNILLRFTLPSVVLPGAVISSATLTLQYTVVAAAARAYEFTRCTQPWVEGEVNHLVYAAGQSWPGGNPYAAANHDDTLMVTGTPPTNADANVTYTITDLVQDALDDRGRELSLWFRRSSPGALGQWAVASSDYAAAASRPKLTITYTNSGGLGKSRHSSYAPRRTP